MAEQGKMMALVYYETVEKCPICGGPKSECQDPSNEHAYEVRPPIRCHYRTQLSRELEQWQNDGRPRQEGLIPQIHLRR